MKPIDSVAAGFTPAGRAREGRGYIGAGRACEGRGYRAGILAVALVLVALGALVGCAPPAARGSEPQDLPEYAYRSAQALKGYQIAVAEQELLARLPCYCGCGQDPQYQSLKDCFLEPEGGFRSHGANCQVCLEEAEDAARWKAQGLSTREIRDRIDREYEGRGKPTDTPPVLD